MIVFVGQVARDMREREAFQELDYRAVFGTMAKWATEIDDPARIPEIVSRAFHVATNGRPGPVVIALPEDMLIERAVVADAPAFEPIETWPGLTDMSQTTEDALGRAAADHDPRRQPLVGQSLGRDAALCRALRPAGVHDLPARASVRSDPSRITAAISASARTRSCWRASRLPIWCFWSARGMGEMSSQSYTLFEIPQPRQTFVHVHPDSDELGRVYRPHLAINASPTAFAAALEGLQAPNTIPWSDETRTAHADYLAYTADGDRRAGRGQSRRDHGLAAR